MVAAAEFMHPRWRAPVALALVCFVSGCNSTSSIDTTLGSVAPTREQALLPPPAQPEASAQASAPDRQANPSFPSAPQAAAIEPVDVAAPVAVVTTPTQLPGDDLVPQLTIRNTGTYPNINDERAPSLEQFSAAERENLTNFMSSLKADHETGAISTAQYEQRLRFLQNLARTHSRDALRRIGAI
ncbi:MAG: hypothetical protein AAFO77_02970 [Pseudomonadota bacterium]